MYPTSYQAYRLKDLSAHWQRAQRLYEFIGARDNECRFVRLRECRKRAWFAIDRESMTIKLLSNACKLRWCPICQSATRACVASQSSVWFQTVRRPKFLTLTLKHSDATLTDQIDRLYKCWRKFRLSALVKKQTRGGIWFFQIKETQPSGTWHPHIHVLLDMNYIPQRALSDLWLKITGDSTVLDIRAIHSEKKAIDYVSRYAGNPIELSDITFEQSIEVYDALHNRRLCGTYGSARSVRLRPQRPSDGGDWQFLMDWDLFARCGTGEPLIALIEMHWRTGLPVTNPNSIALIDHWSHFLNPIPPPNTIDPHPQLYLSFTS